MKNFADRLISSIKSKGNSCIVGLDPRINEMPEFITRKLSHSLSDENIANAITDFHSLVIDAVKDYVPAIKPQIAFYEQYGMAGMQAFENTIAWAKKNGLIVIVDAKRNDIGDTATVYAHAFLGKANILNNQRAIFDVDAITINPYMGIDTIMPFANVCKEYGKGIFVLVKTSNKGSGDFQDLQLKNGDYLYTEIARRVNAIGEELVGDSGYSSVGAVVGATYPDTAAELRQVMKNNFFLVPGYGAQGASGKTISNCYNKDGLGALINASRSITYSSTDLAITEQDFKELIRSNVISMIKDVNSSI